MPSLPWHAIDTVLLDMDGTLLDLHYDNHFWMEHLPQRYAELHGVSRAMAEMELQPLFERNAGQLQWYCLDFWSTELKIPVREQKSRAAWIPPRIRTEIMPPNALICAAATRWPGWSGNPG